MSRSTLPVFRVGDAVCFRSGPRASQKLIVTRITPKMKPNYMGQHYIYNYEVVAQAVVSRMCYKNDQHMFRRFTMAESASSQSMTASRDATATGNLVKELMPSGASASTVGFYSRKTFLFQGFIIFRIY